MHRDLLRRVSLFAELDDDGLSRLAERFSEDVLPEGRAIFERGDPADAFYIVRQGSIALYSDHPGKPIQLQARLGPGDFFGEIGLFDGFERSASARASETSLVLRIGRDDLLAFLEDQPVIAIKLQVAAARRHSQNVSLTLDHGPRDDLRFRLGEPAILVLEAGKKRPVTVENLSHGGICLRGVPPAWQPGFETRFVLHCHGDELSTGGRVTWRRTDLAGLAFTERSASHADSVRRLLRCLLERQSSVKKARQRLGRRSR